MAASTRPSVNPLPSSSTALPQFAPPIHLNPFPRHQPSDGRPPRSRRSSAAGATSGLSEGPSPYREGSIANAGVRSGRVALSHSAFKPAPGAAVVPGHPSRPSPSAVAHPMAVPSALSSGDRVMTGEAKPSYANIVRDPSGPSFIREHSIAVAEFGMLPDIVAEPRISSIGGEPSVFFSPEELQAAENIFSDAIVMKFLSGRPTWEACYSAISSWGLKQQFIMGPLDSRSILLRFRDHSDMIAVLARGSNYISGFPYRAFRWNRLYNIKEDAVFAPVWVSFPRLPIPFYVPSMLRGIAKSIGNFLCFDRPTTLMTRASSARVCIEVDLRKKLPDHVWIGVHGKFKQPIIYERLPKFCNFCKVQGHDVEECKKTPIDKSNPINHGAYEPLVHNGNATAMDTHSNQAPVASPSKLDGDSSIPELNPGSASDPLITSAGQGPNLANPVLGAQQDGRCNILEHTAQPSLQLPMEREARLNNQPIKDVSGQRLVCMTDSMNQHPPNPPLTTSRPDYDICTPGVCQNAAVLNSLPAAVSGQDNTIETGVDTSKAGRTASLNQPPPLQSNSSLLVVPNTEGTPSVCHNVELPSATDNVILVKDQQLAPIKENPKSAAKPIKIKHLDVVQGPSLTQQQQDALERFKKKVKAQTISHGQQLIGSASANPFEALLEDHSDEEDDEYIAASYNSATDDDLVEPMDMGYQSADGRSSHKPIKSTASVMKSNKRHPNIPLNVRLRERKNSYSSYY